MANYKTPGVFILEPPSFPPSIVPVETAIPVFIGHTKKNPNPSDDPFAPIEVFGIDDYKEKFGVVDHKNDFTFDVISRVNSENEVIEVLEVEPRVVDQENVYNYNMYHALRLFYLNGGGRCFVISVAEQGDTIAKELSATKDDYENALKALETADDPTIIVFPDLVWSVTRTEQEDGTFVKEAGDYEAIIDLALEQANERKDRFVVIDVPQLSKGSAKQVVSDDIKYFRDEISNFGFEDRKFGAAYYPNFYVNVNAASLSANDQGEVQTKVNIYEISEDAEKPDLSSDEAPDPTRANVVLNTLKDEDNYAGVYQTIIGELSSIEFIMPPSAAMAGLYSQVDNQRGVFKAPANVTVTGIIKTTVKIDDNSQAGMNVSTSGKSVNAIRTITDRGLVVWGARTLDANNLDFRYINVRRFFNFVEESVKKAMYRFVFEPNDANTWTPIRASIENFLTVQWEVGALQGAKADDAFFVQVGLGQTMAPQDILEGRLRVRIGMAVVRPAEFIILEFTQFLPVS